MEANGSADIVLQHLGVENIV